MKRARSFRSWISRVGIGLAALWLMAACAGAPQGAGGAGAPPGTPEDPGPAVTEVEPTPTRVLGSPELHATDPGSVSLAAGKVQLVEFFAFW